MVRLNANQILGLFLGLFSVGYIWLAYQIPVFPLPRPVDSDAFPKVLGYILAGLSLWLFLEKPEAPGAVDPEQQAAIAALPWWQRPWALVALTSLAILAYAMLLQPLGFVLASILLGCGLSAYYGYRRHGINLLTSSAVVLSLYLLLSRAMGIHLPTGILPL